MKNYRPEQIKNVAVLGHGNAGKTTLVEALLWKAGASDRLGRVDDGTSLSDYSDEELSRKTSVFSSVLPFSCAVGEEEYKFNLIDAPGLFDYEMGQYEALMACESVDLELSEVYRLSGTEDAPKSFGEKLANAFTDGLAATGQTLEDFAVWLAYSWLDVLIFAAVVFVAVKLIGRLRRGKKLPKPVRKKKNAETPADETKTEE